MLKIGDLIVVEHPIDMSKVDENIEYINVVKITSEQIKDISLSKVTCNSGLVISRYRIKYLLSGSKLIDYYEYNTDKILFENNRLEKGVIDG